MDNHDFLETSGLNPPEGLKGIEQGLMTTDLLGHQRQLQARLTMKRSSQPVQGGFLQEDHSE